MINTKQLLPLALSLGLPLGLNAAWNAEFLFESQDERSRIGDYINIENSNARSVIEDGVLKVYPGDLFDQTSNVYTMLQLSEDLKAASIASTGVVTMYFELIQPEVDGSKSIVDTVWGLSNIDPATILDDRFNSYNAMARINSGNDNFEVRNAGNYEAIGLLQTGVRYSMWLVLDYNLNYFEYYVQGGQWESITRLGAELASGGFYGFRFNPASDQTIDYFLVALSRGNTTGGEKGKGPTYFDNIYIDTAGENLTTPGGSSDTWAGYSVNASGWADTGSFMGAVYVGTSDLGGWVYPSGLADWIYMPEDFVGSSGSWGYIIK